MVLLIFVCQPQPPRAWLYRMRYRDEFLTAPTLYQICGSIELQVLTFLIFAVVSGVGIFGTTKIYKEFMAMGNWSLSRGEEKNFGACAMNKILLETLTWCDIFGDNFCWVWHAHDNWWPLIPCFFSPCSSVYRPCSHQLAQWGTPDFKLGCQGMLFSMDLDLGLVSRCGNALLHRKNSLE